MGDADGQILLHPDEAITGVLAGVFDRFAACGSVRATWLWLRDNLLRWPLQRDGYRRDRLPEITWVELTYHAVHTTLTHPAYAGAYVFGRTRRQRYLAADGHLRARDRRLRADEWKVLVTDHHPKFIDWDTYQSNRGRIGGNIRRSHTSRAPAGCGKAPPCCRAWPAAAGVDASWPCSTAVRRSPPRLLLPRHRELVDGKGVRHLNVGGQAIEAGHDAVPGPAPPPGRTSLLRSDQGRAPLPGRRSGEPRCCSSKPARPSHSYRSTDRSTADNDTPANSPTSLRRFPSAILKGATSG